VLSASEEFVLKNTGYAGVIDVSDDDKWILTGSDKAPDDAFWTAKLWNAETGDEVAKFGKHGSQVTAIAFSDKTGPEGQLTLATADAGGRCVLWEWSPGEQAPVELRKLSQPRLGNQKAHTDRIVSVRFLPGGTRVLTASHDTVVAQWDVATGNYDPALDLIHKEKVGSLELGPEGRFAVTTCFDNVIRVWNVQTAQVVREMKPEGRVGTLVGNVADRFASKGVGKEKLEQAWKMIKPDADYQQFLDQGGWSQGVEQLLTLIPEQLGNLKEPPTQLASDLARRGTALVAERGVRRDFARRTISPCRQPHRSPRPRLAIARGPDLQQPGDGVCFG